MRKKQMIIICSSFYYFHMIRIPLCEYDSNHVKESSAIVFCSRSNENIYKNILRY